MVETLDNQSKPISQEAGTKEISKLSLMDGIKSLADPDKKVQATRISLYYLLSEGRHGDSLALLGDIQAPALPFAEGERKIMLEAILEEAHEQGKKNPIDAFMTILSVQGELKSAELGRYAHNGFFLARNEFSAFDKERFRLKEQDALRRLIEYRANPHYIKKTEIEPNRVLERLPEYMQMAKEQGYLKHVLEVLPEAVRKQLVDENLLPEGIIQKLEPAPKPKLEGEDKIEADKSQGQETIGDKDQLFKDGRYIEGSLRERLSDPNQTTPEKQQIVLAALKKLLRDEIIDNLVKENAKFNPEQNMTHQLLIFYTIDYPVGNNPWLKSELMKMCVDIVQAKPDNWQPAILGLFADIHPVDFRKFLPKDYRNKVLVETQERIMKNQPLDTQEVGVLLADIMAYKDSYLQFELSATQERYFERSKIFGNDEWSRQDINEWKNIFFSSLTSYTEAIEKHSDVSSENIQFLKQEIELLSKGDKKQWYRDNQDLIKKVNQNLIVRMAERKGIFPLLNEYMPPSKARGILSKLNSTFNPIARRRGLPPPPASSNMS